MNSVIITYDDFCIRFGPRRRGKYPIDIMSPAGQARAEMRLPFSLERIQTLREELEDQMWDGWQVGKDFGAKLFDALFADRRAIRFFERNLGLVNSAPSRGLRIKLHFALDVPELAALSTLPWEFLYDTVSWGFIGTSIKTSIVRYLNVSRPMHGTQRLPELRSPLSILAVLSGPKDKAELDLADEKNRIERTMADLRKRDLVALEYLVPPTLEKLHERCSNTSFFIIHFAGHGGFKDGQPVLWFEDENGISSPVSGEVLSTFLQDQGALQFVFLNACKTSNVPAQHDIAPLNSVAAALVNTGTPAVLAMQFLITDSAAIKFSQEVYGKLAEGYPVDMAVASGRQAILAKQPSSLEWGTPVLFMHVPDGRLFHVERESVKPSPLPKYDSDPRNPQYEDDTVRLKSDVLDIVAEKLNLEELKTLCFRLGVYYDDLPGEGKPAKARELIEYVSNRNLLLELVQQILRDREDIVELEPIEAQLSLLRESEEEYADTST